MKYKSRLITTIALLLLVGCSKNDTAATNVEIPPPPALSVSSASISSSSSSISTAKQVASSLSSEVAVDPLPSVAVATFAGGCFWCMEKPYESVAGVISVISGFSGGSQQNPSYKEVANGATSHREVVQVTYNPQIVSYNELLDVFWRQINPTDDGGQFADRGFHYTTAIFYHDQDQKNLAEASKSDISLSGKFNDPIVTPILPYQNFYKAEEYHQDYYKKNPQRYSIYYKGSGRAGYLQSLWGDS